jgi:hypothetical protein
LLWQNLKLKLVYLGKRVNRKVARFFSAPLVASAAAVVLLLAPDISMVEPHKNRALVITFAILAWLLTFVRYAFGTLSRHQPTAAPFAVALFSLATHATAWLLAILSALLGLLAVKNSF